MIRSICINKCHLFNNLDSRNEVLLVIKNHILFILSIYLKLAFI